VFVTGRATPRSRRRVRVTIVGTYAMHDLTRGDALNELLTGPHDVPPASRSQRPRGRTFVHETMSAFGS
jgi:hypothetical protein